MSKHSQRIQNEIVKLSSMLVTAVLIQKHNENTGNNEWALVSKKDHDKVLKWFGAEKPSDAAVAKEEARVQYFKHQG